MVGMLADVNGMPASIESAGAEAPLTSLHHSGKGMQCSVTVHLVGDSEDGPAGPPAEGGGHPPPPDLGEEPEEDPEQARQALYRLMGAEENHETHPSPISLSFNTGDTSKIGGMIRRMLQCPAGEGRAAT